VLVFDKDDDDISLWLNESAVAYLNESNDIKAPSDFYLNNGVTVLKGTIVTVKNITDDKLKHSNETMLLVSCSKGKNVLRFNNNDPELKKWLNESAVAYKVPRSTFANPWLTHKIQSASWIRPYEFGNAFNDGIVNAEVACTGCVAKEDSIETATDIKAVYVNEYNEICFAPAVPAYISENGQINSADEFKEYAKVVLKEAHGDDYDESIADKTISGILDKYDNNYGAMVKLNTITIPTTGRTAFKDSANFCRIFGFNNFNIGLSFL
jgi:hypothetical protein